MIHRTRERAEADFVRRNFSGQRHGHIRTTVKAAAKRNHARASGMGASNFHRVFHRFRTGGEERGFGLPAHRGKGVDFLRQGDVAFIRHNLIRGVGKLLQLLLHRRDQIRVAMSGIQHRNACGEIDVLVALNILQRGVFSRLGEEVTHHANPARGGRKTTLMEFIVAHVSHLLTLHG